MKVYVVTSTRGFDDDSVYLVEGVFGTAAGAEDFAHALRCAGGAAVGTEVDDYEVDALVGHRAAEVWYGQVGRRVVGRGPGRGRQQVARLRLFCRTEMVAPDVYASDRFATVRPDAHGLRARARSADEAEKLARDAFLPGKIDDVVRQGDAEVDFGDAHFEEVPVYAVIETDTGDGHVRGVVPRRTLDRAIDLVVETAKDDGCIDPPHVTEAQLRRRLREDLCYLDGDVLTTICRVSCPAPR